MRVVGCVEFGHSNARRSSQSTPAHAERTVAQPERAGAALARARECAGARGGQHARQRSAQVPPCRRKRVVPESPWFITQLIPVHERGPARGATSEHVESATTGSTRNVVPACDLKLRYLLQNLWFSHQILAFSR